MAWHVLQAALALALVRAPDPDAIERLVERLGAASWTEREAAAAELLSCGPHAVPALEKALDGDDAEVRHRAALLLDHLRWRPPGGVSDALRDAMQHYTSLPQAQRSALLARVVGELGSDAGEVLRQVLRRDPSETVRLEALSRLRRLDPDAAETELRALADDEDRACWAWEQLGHELYRRGNAPGAIAAYQSAREAGSTDVRVATSLARLHMRQRQWAAARDLFRQLVADDEGNLDLLRELGQCLFMLGDEREAEAAWRRMVDAQRGTPDAYRTLAQAYNAIGARDKELEALREGCEKHPTDYDLLRQLARAFTREQRYGEAIAILERALHTAGADYQRRAIVVELARVLRLSRQLRDYLGRHEQALAELDRDIASLLSRLARQHLADGDRAGARAALERIIACFPDTAVARWARERLAQPGTQER